MSRHFLTAGLLAGTWFLWSGHTKPLILLWGALSVLLVMWLRARMDAVDGSREKYVLGFRPLLYVPWLLKEILLSNLHVAKVIVSPSLPIRPRLVRVPANQRTELGQVWFANSITLTPGTLTLDTRDGEFLVHALTDVTAEGLLEGTMDRKCAALEGDA